MGVLLEGANAENDMPENDAPENDTPEADGEGVSVASSIAIL
jgi:hypothetical protein